MTATATEIRSLGLTCLACAVLVANDDDSAHDVETAELAAATAAAIRTDEGGTLVVDPEAARECELFRCALCGDDCFGAAVPLVIVTEGDPVARSADTPGGPRGAAGGGINTATGYHAGRTPAAYENRERVTCDRAAHTDDEHRASAEPGRGDGRPRLRRRALPPGAGRG